MALLGQDEIHNIHKAVISADLVDSRDVLLSHIEPTFVALLPTAPSPSAQILSDLGRMNTIGALADGSVPLRLWLKTAACLAELLPQAAVFADALDRCGETIAAPSARFEVIPDDLVDSSPMTHAAKMLTGEDIPAPSREILFSPQGTPQFLLPRAGIEKLIETCRIWTVRHQSIFPSILPRDLNPERKSQGLLWKWDRHDVGWFVHFSAGFDGSFMLREFVREAIIPASMAGLWSSAVDVSTCLDRVIGAVLFARRLAFRCPLLQYAQFKVALVGINNQALVLRGSTPSLREITLGRSTSPEATVAFRIATNLNDAEIAMFAAAVGEHLTYYFGWDWNPSVVESAIHNIFSNVQNSDPER